MSIKDFLLARIAEDEALAGAAAISMHGERHTERWDYTSYVLGAERDSTEAQDMFIREFWPARVLAECAAKRAIIETYVPIISHPHPEATRYPHAYADDVCQVQIGDRFYDAAYVPEEIARRWDSIFPIPGVLQHLAAAYSDHPDYQEGWMA